MKKILQIDPYFSRLSVPITEVEQRQLEASLLREGCKEPIVVWNGVILDGHKRYEICSYEEISFKVVNKEFGSREEAASWLCSTRVPYLKISSAIYKYLVGEKYLFEKALYDRAAKIATKNGRKIEQWRGSCEIGGEFGINRSSVQRFGKLASFLDMIAEKDAVLFDAIREERIHVTYPQAENYAQMDSTRLANMRRKLLREEDIKMRRRYPDTEKAAKNGKKESQLRSEEKPLEVKIKDMPAYDPDMEIRGLALTIPTWMNAIARTKEKSKIELVSTAAKTQLAGSLHRLEDQIAQMLEVIEK